MEWTLPKKFSNAWSTSDKTTIVIERQPDGKMRVASGSWDGEKVFLKDQVLEVRHAIADARLHGSQNQGTGRVGPTDPGAMTRMARATPRATSSLITETALRRMQRRCAGMQRHCDRMQGRSPGCSGVAPLPAARAYRMLDRLSGFSGYWFVTVGEQPRIQPSVSWIAKSSFDPVSISIGRQNSRQRRLSRSRSQAHCHMART